MCYCWHNRKTARHTFYFYSFYSSYACQTKPKIGTLLPLCKVDYLYYCLSFTLWSIPAANAWCENDIMPRECDRCLHTKHRQSIKPLPLFVWANTLFDLQRVPVWLHICFSCWLKLGIWWHGMCFHMLRILSTYNDVFESVPSTLVLQLWLLLTFYPLWTKMYISATYFC